MTWRSSTYSGESGNCVQIRGDLAAVRDSKNPQRALELGRTSLARLTAFARAGRF
ncbi:DUF397 domain-containing protein [Actinophytocola xanthii]|uniref:DUF397 domain-containing protein n=1 Tax=Actinophytocola xanthii TaxID=1912961 RepID=A0A1Q8CLD7_9PSEU|nr:DUF397 domain-containing protein [Actinophytocola xanthii]OLF15159.1 hypothetical protein BU204_23090 [Actinophytocola xanthii]